MAGAAIQWLRDGLHLIARADESGPLAAAADPEQAVYLVPAFTGLGAPWWDAHARGAMFGLTRNTGPKEIARAALDAVCYPDPRSSGRHARRLARRVGHGAAGGWRHGGQRLDAAAPGRHSGCAGGSAGGAGNHGPGRGLAGGLGSAVSGPSAKASPKAGGASRRFETDMDGAMRARAGGGLAGRRKPTRTWRYSA